MNTNDLYIKLKKAFCAENLHKITTRIVQEYRQKNYGYIYFIANSIELNVPEEDKINKIFPKLLMLYHPDKLAFYLNEIEYNRKNTNKLNQFSHILIVLNHIDKPFEKDEIYDSQVYTSEAQYIFDESEFDRIVDIDEDYYSSAGIEAEFDIDQTPDFISALKQKEYGNLNINFSKHDLENMEGHLELCGYGIEDLSGLELCENLLSIDFSNNNIFDISSLSFLYLLEEIYLGGNHIYNIDVLSHLSQLRILDLSFNPVVDIQPLFELENLSYINILGNKIPDNQVNVLQQKGVLVIT